MPQRLGDPSDKPVDVGKRSGGSADALQAFPVGPGGRDTLPNVTNQQIKHAGVEALKWLPAVGATGAALFQPELAPVAANFWAEAAAAGGAAAIGGAAGRAVELGGRAAAGEPVPQGIGALAKDVGGEALKQGAIEFGGRVVTEPVFGWLGRKFGPEAMMQSAIKPSTRLEVGASGKLAAPSKASLAGNMATHLREAIPASEGGYRKLIAAVNETTAEIDKQVATKSPQLGAVISPSNIAKRLDAMIQHYEDQAYPDADIATIRKVRDSFMARHSTAAPYTTIAPNPYGGGVTGGFVPTGSGVTMTEQAMTLAEAQAEKRGTYKFNQRAYGQLSDAQAEAEKQLAFGLKEQIAQIFPEIQALNAKDTALLQIEDDLRRFVVREGNKNRVGLIPAIVGSAAATAGLTEGHAAGGGVLALTILALDNPVIKSNLAIALARARASIGGRALGRLGKEALPSIGRALTVENQ